MHESESLHCDHDFHRRAPNAHGNLVQQVRAVLEVARQLRHSARIGESTPALLAPREHLAQGVQRRALPIRDQPEGTSPDPDCVVLREDQRKPPVPDTDAPSPHRAECRRRFRPDCDRDTGRPAAAGHDVGDRPSLREPVPVEVDLARAESQVHAIGAQRQIGRAPASREEQPAVDRPSVGEPPGTHAPRLREREPAREAEHAEVAGREDAAAAGIASVHPRRDVATPTGGVAVGGCAVVAVDDADLRAAQLHAPHPIVIGRHDAIVEVDEGPGRRGTPREGIEDLVESFATNPTGQSDAS